MGINASSIRILRCRKRIKKKGRNRNKKTPGYDLHISMFNLLERGNLMKKFIGLILAGVVVAALVLVALTDVMIGMHIHGIPIIGDGTTGGAIKDGGGAPILESATLFLLGSGMISLGEYGRKKFFKK